MKLAIIGWGNVGRALGRLLKQKQREFPFAVTGIHTLHHGTAIDPAGLSWEAIEAARFGPPAFSIGAFLDAARANCAIELTTLDPATGEPAIGHIRAAIDAKLDYVLEFWAPR